MQRNKELAALPGYSGKAALFFRTEIKEFASSYCDIKGEVMIAGRISFDMIETEEDSINVDSVPKEMINTERISDEKTDKPFEKRSLKCIIYPNPVNGKMANIRYLLKESGSVLLSIYDASGQKVADVVNEHQDKGAYSVSWMASRAPAGLYIAKIVAGDFSKSVKFIIEE